ncbi:glycosyltransferase [Massilia sp. TS11]|uniref:O-linked N-acetylglucosamine transferase family protein n=1 Tax=Massilia sp. TS11 TaxID=2908003 RepID=UPI001EDB2B9B|nr:glycosyltransferase [Massilia sp. TS11]MCG2586643.1 glycosyltransferase [Massilia sp. TS11]
MSKKKTPPPAHAAAEAPLSAQQILEFAFRSAEQGTLSIVDLFNVAGKLGEAGQKQMAIELYRRWLAATATPVAYAAQFNLGVLLSDTGDLTGAEGCYRAAVAQNPAFCEGLLNLGTLLERMGRPEEALEQWRKVLDVANPEVATEKAHHVQGLNNLGRLLEILKRYPDAEDMLTRSLAINPEQTNVMTHWVHLRQKQCKWPVYSSSASGIAEDKLLDSTSALAMLSASGDPAMQLAASRRFIEEKVVKDVARLSGPVSYGHSRLRIGYLSGDFCAHAVSILTAELYGLHDRNRVEVYGFDWSREDGSSLRQRVTAGFDHHIRLHSVSDEDAAKLIRQHEIDILVDLQGLTHGARPNILMYRPAPVQITWLGLPGPTAHPEIDYVIADPTVLPPELEPYFSEKPLHMPRCFQINDRQRQVGATPTRAALSLPEDAFVYCAFNNNFKINPEMFETWMRILKRVPDSVLWLVSDHETVRTNLWRQAELHGVARERLIFAERALPADYLARYRVADLFLDTRPFGGGTTTSDALWAGLPVLACMGRTFASRMSGSLLKAVGLPELITDNVADYEEKAVAIGQDRAKAAAYKTHLAEVRDSCALFDSEQFVRDLEDAYERVAIGGAPKRENAAERKPLARPASTSKLPRVSILIPTHNRPEYTELALKSALAQGWENLEVVISDNSDNEQTAERLAPLLKANPHVTYLRQHNTGPMDNFNNCLAHASGEFINYLMDDDLFHPAKIERMMAYMLARPDIGLVTSFRQLIDKDGNFMAPIPGTERLFPNETMITGQSLGDMLLTNGSNIIGEPTTALFRRAAIGEKFGLFLGKQYSVLSDVATWLAALTEYNCVYLPEALSYFRIHGGQDSARGNVIRINSNIEWLELLCDAHQHGKYIRSRAQVHDMLTNKLVTCMWFMSSMHEELKKGVANVDRLQAVIKQATDILYRA